ncbi:MAG: ATP-binding protein, partial [Nitrospirota bacterium]|nr:ATP-binding protein [Nitrospirota bacterium]
DVSKIEAGMIDVHVDDFDIFDLVSEAAKSFEKEAKDRGIGLKVELIHLMLNTDRRRLLQSVMNLISNAVKFTEKGSVQITARAVHSLQFTDHREENTLNRQPSTVNDGDFVEISVEDTGIGMKEVDIPKLFQSFVRLDSPLRATVPGTGLGLYLTNKLVLDALKGDIMVESRLGEGSRFEIRIPIKIGSSSK